MPRRLKCSGQNPERRALHIMPISEETTQGGKGLEVPGAGAGAGLGTVPAPSRQNVEPRNPRCSG